MENKYANYQSMVTSVTTGISQLDGVCRNLSMDAQADELAGISDRLQNHIFSVGIMGEFKRGKSTVINALLGSEIVPADIVPCSATLNYIKWDASKHAIVKFKDGTEKDIAVDELSDYITKLTEKSEKQAEKVDNATVYYPCPFCQNGVQIIDTPGLNDDERMTAISESVIPTLDAIIMVTVPSSPFSQSEADFVRNKIMASDLGRIIFVVNQIDLVDEDDRERILDHIKSKIKSSVLEKMEKIYGSDSDEYNNAKEKLAGIRVLGISAKQALKAKLNGDEKVLEESGFLEFESVLSKLLTEERGALELIHPVNQIISAAKTSLETIETRLNALELDSEEFEKIQKESMEKIKETRKKKKDEISLLKAKGKTLYADLLPELDTAYEEVCNASLEYVNEISITEDDVSSQANLEAFSNRIGNELQKNIEDQFSVATEKLANKVDDQLGKDVEELKNFGMEFNETIEKININLSSKAVKQVGGNDFMSTVKSSLVDVGVMYGTLFAFGEVIPGIGGLLAGWREHGFKGAAIGGLSGAGIGIAVAALATPLGIVGIPLALIMGAASTFGGKAIANLIFGKSKGNAPATSVNSIESVKSQLISSTEKAVEDMQRDKVLEKWLKDFCENAYESVAGNIDQEWENTLVTLEQNLSQIKTDLQMNESNKQNIKNDMDGYVKIVNEVLIDVKPIHEKLSFALNAN